MQTRQTEPHEVVEDLLRWVVVQNHQRETLMKTSHEVVEDLPRRVVVQKHQRKTLMKAPTCVQTGCGRRG